MDDQPTWCTSASASHDRIEDALGHPFSLNIAMRYALRRCGPAYAMRCRTGNIAAQAIAAHSSCIRSIAPLTPLRFVL